MGSSVKWLCFLFVWVVPFYNVAWGQDGEALFLTNCASCHAVARDLTGPALADVRERVTDHDLLYAWIRNSKKVLAEGDPYFTELYEKWNRVAMNLYPTLKDEEITAILDYVDNKAKVAKKNAAASDSGGGQNMQEEQEGDITLYIIILLALVVITYGFKKINTNLEQVIASKKGEKVPPRSPFYRNKKYWVVVFLAISTIVGFNLAIEGMTTGIQQNYQPTQPIFFSHRVHADVHKINCQYCHSTAAESKHALIPSVNVCMNCHQAINEYSGVALVDEEGNAIDGTKEIQKLYEYANFTPGRPWKPKDLNKSIEWVRVHNLPDHVKFNHSQHVTVGKQECQTCHGQIEKMDEVYQYSTLSMGWCIQCHRQTEVQFIQNNFYEMYRQLHEDLKNGKLDKVTVSDIGGTECQKCHH